MNTIITPESDMQIADKAVSVLQCPAGILENLSSAYESLYTRDSANIEKMQLGGSLRMREIDALSKINGDLKPAIFDAQTWLSDVVRLDFTAQCSIKIFGPRKPGMSAHRDSDQPNAGESVNAVIGVHGFRENGLWVIPRSFIRLAEPGRRNPVFRPDLADEMEGTVSGFECTVTPYRRIASSPGLTFIVDERKGTGTWQSNTLGDVALEHSSNPLDKAISLVCRAYPVSN